MHPIRSTAAALLVLMLGLPPAAVASERAGAAASPVTDVVALHAFLESRPTPDEFQEAFPEVWLVLPGDIVSREYCSQFHRFIAELDTDGRIAGGSLE
jgi:hypothetical protein